MEALRTSGTVKETVTSCIESLRLKGVPIRHFIGFKRLRELNEKLLEKESRHLTEEVISTSYRASMKDDD